MKRLNSPVTVKIKVPEIKGLCHDKLAGSKSQKFCLVKERCGVEDDFWFTYVSMPFKFSLFKKFCHTKYMPKGGKKEYCRCKIKEAAVMLGYS